MNSRAVNCPKVGYSKIISYTRTYLFSYLQLDPKYLVTRESVDEFDKSNTASGPTPPLPLIKLWKKTLGLPVVFTDQSRGG
jgi:hypothetical protein